jgi:hypothetical protein
MHNSGEYLVSLYLWGFKLLAYLNLQKWNVGNMEYQLKKGKKMWFDKIQQ